MKRLGVCFSGRSNSGKTTLILKIAKELIARGFKVAIIKHDPGDKASFGEPQKDSTRFFNVGAQVAVLSPKRTSIFLNQGFFGGEERINSLLHNAKKEQFSTQNNSSEDKLGEIIRHFGEFDYLLVEGLKYLPLPRICVFRDEIDESFVPFANAFATNLKQIKLSPNYDLDDISGLIKWIDANAKRL